jgi:putative copper export protein
MHVIGHSVPMIGHSARAALVVARTGATGPQLSDGLGGFRLILHVLAATVWVGGQFTVAGLLPTLRSLGDDAPKKVAAAFARLLWPAYAVLVITGFWNISALTVKDASSAWKTVLIIKIVVVVLAGVGVFLHQRAATRRATALWGAVGSLASVVALCLGVFLAG